MLNPYSPGSFMFLSPNTISAIGDDDSVYKSIEINSNLIVFPEMNRDEYNAIVEKWGTDEFYIVVIAENDNSSVNSTVMILDRSHSAGDNSSNNENVYWWV